MAAQAQANDQDAASASMQQIIEAARRKKAQELELAARRLLGAETPAAAAPTAPSLPAASAPPVAEPLPRVWSISGVDQRLEAELYFKGRLYPVTMRGDQPSRVGPWVVSAITPSGVTLMPAPGAAGASHGPHPITLAPPARGTSLSRYPFTSPIGAFPDGSATLPPSALRAAQLPLE